VILGIEEQVELPGQHFPEISTGLFFCQMNRCYLRGVYEEAGRSAAEGDDMNFEIGKGAPQISDERREQYTVSKLLLREDRNGVQGPTEPGVAASCWRDVLQQTGESLTELPFFLFLWLHLRTDFPENIRLRSFSGLSIIMGMIE
jgi:hypothetical protein